jgi:glycine hydroxymethyltransferase
MGKLHAVAHILVVCTGNICRSPMAEGFLREELADRGIQSITVSSCGVAAWDGGQATVEAVEAMHERGIDIGGHAARRLAHWMLEETDLVLTMAVEHREAVDRMDPEVADRAFTIKELVAILDGPSPPAPGDPAAQLEHGVRAAATLRAEGRAPEILDEDVADPLGLSLPAYQAAAWELGELSGGCPRTCSTRWTEPGGPGPARREPTLRQRRSPRRRPLGGVVHRAAWRPGGMSDHAASWEQLRATDPEVAQALVDEIERERSTLRLIASENYASPAVLAALGSTMNNKYAEGYPGRRYYGGCEVVDVTETLAIERAKQLFGADHANVQPHAGAQANMAVYGAFLSPKDPDQSVLGLVLPHGGHLTHGSPVNFSGKWFTFVGYEVDKDSEVIDMDRVRDLALEHRPRMILAGFTAYPRTIDFAAFRQIADEVGALFMVDASHFIGLVAGGAYPSPVPHADVVSFTTHKTLRGPRGAIILCRAEHAKAIDKAVFPMMQGGPLEHVIAAKAVCLREAMQPDFATYAERTVRTARALADGLAAEGLRLVSGGTDSHLALVDLQPIGLTGADAEAACEAVGVALNKNAIPFDPLPPATASGIRVGTPGPATLGWTARRWPRSRRSSATCCGPPRTRPCGDGARGRVRDLMARFPVYPG